MFDSLFDAWSRSPAVRSAWRDAYAGDYPEGVDPLSYVTLGDLQRIAARLAVGPGSTFADIGCGRGGPGLWVARATGASLVGIDVSQVAVDHATLRAGRQGFGDRARFQRGHFAATGLPSDAVDGAMSVDALWITADKAAAVREVARIVRPGARFVFTTWDVERAPAGWPTPVRDHSPLLRSAGFAVETYEETPGWERLQRAVYANLRAARDRIVAEMGARAAAPLFAEADEMTGVSDGTDYLAHMRRIFIVARKA